MPRTAVEAIQDMIDATVETIHTCLPGYVQRYDYQTCKAEVLLSTRPLWRDSDMNEFDQKNNFQTILSGVPVIWPRTQAFMLHAPLNKNDPVLVLFCERSIDDWVANAKLGKVIQPKLRRKYSLSDAVCIPGLFPFSSAPLADSNDEVQIWYNNSVIRMQSDGTVDINNGNLVVEL